MKKVYLVEIKDVQTRTTAIVRVFENLIKAVDYVEAKGYTHLRTNVEFDKRIYTEEAELFFVVISGKEVL